MGLTARHDGPAGTPLYSAQYHLPPAPARSAVPPVRPVPPGEADRHETKRKATPLIGLTQWEPIRLGLEFPHVRTLLSKSTALEQQEKGG